MAKFLNTDAQAIMPEFLLAVATCQWPPSPEREMGVARALQQPIDWVEFVRLVQRHRIAGLAYHALSKLEGNAVPESALLALKPMADKVARLGLRAAAETARLSSLLENGHVPCVAYKGAALAVLAYGNIVLKQSRDIDLLVAPQDAGRADALLRAEGYRREKPEMSVVGAAFREFMLRRSQTEYVHPEHGHVVEVHIRLQNNPALGADINPRDKKREWQTVTLGGALQVRTLHTDELLAHLCTHGAEHAWFRLKWLADVNALLAQDTMAPTRLLRTAYSIGTERAAMQAMLLCHEFWGTSLPDVKSEMRGREVGHLVRGAQAAMMADQPHVYWPAGEPGNNPIRLSILLFSGHPLRMMRAVLFELLQSNDPERLPARLRFLQPVLRVPVWLAEKARRPLALLRQAVARRGDLRLLMKAVEWLLTAWLAIDVLPGKMYRKLLKPRVRERGLGDDAAREFADRVSWAVQAAAKRVPWRCVCFHQGIAAQQLLCRGGVAAEIQYGVAKSEEKGMEAHVWVTAQGRTIVGGATKDRFTVLAIFEGEKRASLRLLQDQRSEA